MDLASESYCFFPYQFGNRSENDYRSDLSVCHFVLEFFSPFSIAITSLGEERANLSAFRTFVRFLSSSAFLTNQSQFRGQL